MYNYELLIEDFENIDKTQPYFAFNVTMQNHGGYAVSAENFDECVYATSVSKYYNKANKYLSLVKASVDAFKGLVEAPFSTSTGDNPACLKDIIPLNASSTR